MILFKLKLVGKGRAREKIQIIISFRSCVIENSKQIAKKFKKLEEYQFGSFKAKRGLEMPRKRENKNYCSVPFLHDT